jgi:hypothetical protein
MKNIFLLLCLSFSFSVNAITWEVQGKGHNSIAKGSVLDADLTQAAGKIIIEQMRLSPLLNFDGDETGINSLNGLKSETEFSTEEKWVKAYGWCYSINGVVPDDYAHQVYFKSNEDHLKWFYGYAYYLNGKWLKMCIPFNDAPPQN